MKTVTLRMEDEFHKKLKLKMVNEEKTMQDYIIELIANDINKEKNSK